MAVPESTTTRPPEFLNLPSKVMKKLFTYLNPFDCFNLAQVSPKTLNLVKKRSKFELNSVYLRFDDERSCIGCYFEKQKYTAYVIYTWQQKPERAKHWFAWYTLKQAKFASYMYNNRTQPSILQNFRPKGQEDYIASMMETYHLLLSVFPKRVPFITMGINVCDKLSTQSFASCNIKKVKSIRLFGPGEAPKKRIREVLRNVVDYDMIRVGWRIGVACLEKKVTNALYLILDDPQWITRDHLLNLNCLSVDIGHNDLTPDDLNAFLMQWMFNDKNFMRCERLEIMLSPEAFCNKKAILENLPIVDWDPKNREGEHFEVERYLHKKRIKDPKSFLDCKNGKDLIRWDGRLATVQFYYKKMHFIVWRDKFPYRTLKAARQRKMEEKARDNLVKALRAAVSVIAVRIEDVEWSRRLDAFEAEFSARRAVEDSRKAAEAEDRTAKRKYFEALKEFMDTSAPEKKRRLLRTITIFK